MGKGKKLTTEEFIIEANCVHDTKYDYSLTNYINAKTKIQIICNIHGVFQQRPDNHLRSAGCEFCGIIKSKITRSHTTSEFIHNASQIHNNKYVYNNTQYINAKTKLCITCVDHGDFSQTPHDHLNGKGCPICSESKGENIIREFLITNNIQYVNQYKFDLCRFKRKLPFDFYLPLNNCCIEYDGEQHFKSKDFFGGVDAFNNRKLCDGIKTKFCEDNGIRLIRIPYTEFNNIEHILLKELLPLNN